MFARGASALVAVLSLLSASDVLRRAEAHPGCADGRVLSQDPDPLFCPTDADELYAYGFCCDAAKEAEIKLQLQAKALTGRCAEMYKEVLCATCHPYSLHLFERLGTGLTMTDPYCTEFYGECATQLDLPDDYCDFHTGEPDEVWAYPLVIDDQTFDGQLVQAFPDVDLPEQPIDMRMTPDGTKWWIVGMEGQIVEIDVSDPESPPTSAKLVLDISDDMLLSYEEGLFSVAFSPGFHSTGVFFISYTPTIRAGSTYGFNRLSRFEYDASSAANTRASEEVLVESSDKNFVYHSAGWIGFKPSAYESPDTDVFHALYWAIGDSGNQLDDSLQAQNKSTLHGSIVRISVDSNMGDEEPRYLIPEGNPFKNGGGLPEICAQGFRNPFKCSFDRSNDELWCGDVGQYQVESIKKVECGNNYGWRQFEGHRCTYEIDDGHNEFPLGCADSGVRDPYTFPEFSYCHPDYDHESEPDYLLPEIPNDDFCGGAGTGNGVGDSTEAVHGTAIIGGYVYRGSKYGDLLGGNYLFADYTEAALYHLAPKADGWGTAGGNKWSYGKVNSGDFVKAASFAEAHNGELYVIEHNGLIWELPCGSLCNGVGVVVETTTPSPVPPFPTPSPVSLLSAQGPMCSNGIPGIEGSSGSGTVCCSLTCLNDDGRGECGGNRCGSRDGGKAACCIGMINREGVDCADSGEAPCFIAEDVPVPTTPAAPPTAAPVLGDTIEGPMCSNGIPGIEGSSGSGVACCSSACLDEDGEPKCGGNGCGFRDGGKSACCIGMINRKGDDCADTGEAPCFIAPESTGGYEELGCAADPNPGLNGGRVMTVGPIKANVMSAEICYDICADELPGFAHFGTQYRTECFCAMTLPDYVSFDPEHDGCIGTCAGNPGEICGGTYAITVYSVE